MTTRHFPRLLPVALAFAGLAVVTACKTPAPPPHAQPKPAVVLDETAISVADGSAHEHEPSIAVSPHGHTIVSFLAQSSAGFTVGYRISNDFGATWGDATLFPMPDGENTQANASVAVDDDDNVYMAWGAEEHTVAGRSNQHVLVARAGPGETTLGAPAQIDSSADVVVVYDLVRIFASHEGGLHVSYMQENANGTVILVDARSTDGGTTWTRGSVAGPGTAQSFRNFGRMCEPVEGGRIYVAYADTDLAHFSGDLGVGLRSSDDDGVTWSDAVVVPTDTDELTNPGFGIDCVAAGDDVWVSYAASVEANLGASSVGGGIITVMPTLDLLRVAHSSDRGASIAERFDVEDTGAGSHYMYPVITAEPAGAVDVAYYAGSGDNDAAAKLVRSRAVDGHTFAAAVPVHSSLVLEIDRTAARWGGDYIGRAFVDGNLYLVYTDNASETPHIDFLRIPIDDAAAADAGQSLANTMPPAASEGCYPNTAFTPRVWAPPTAFAQGVCAGPQIDAYVACISSSTGDCSAFRSDAANASCLACIETDAGAAQHGPIVTTNEGGQVIPIAMNSGGCQAHFDGAVDESGCGAKSNAFNDCIYDECGACSDYASPTQGGPTYNCYYTASDVGACTAERETTECANEVGPGGLAASCLSITAFLPQWCGTP